MIKILLLSITQILFLQVFCQGRLVIANNAYIVIDGASKLVVPNSATNSIATIGGGNIISENENDAVVWYVGAGTGVYTVPFTTKPIVQGGAGVKIPLTVNVSSAGNAGGRIDFATYETSTDFNLPYPVGVTDLNNTQGIDGSLYTVDRFWIMNNSSYTTKPSASITFGYDDGLNEMGGANLMLESDLVAQRWNSNLGDWQAVQLGSVNVAANTVSNVNVTNADFWEVWTLQSVLSPLAIKMTDFHVESNENCDLTIYWEIAEAANYTNFLISESYDGIEWKVVNNIEISPEKLDYSYNISDTRSGTSYFKLSTLDENGLIEEVRIVSHTGCSEDIDVFPNPFTDMIYIKSNVSGDAALYDNTGRIVNVISLFSGVNEIVTSDLKDGVYHIDIMDEKGNRTIKKIVKN